MLFNLNKSMEKKQFTKVKYEDMQKLANDILQITIILGKFDYSENDQKSINIIEKYKNKLFINGGFNMTTDKKDQMVTDIKTELDKLKQTHMEEDIENIIAKW